MKFACNTILMGVTLPLLMLLSACTGHPQQRTEKAKMLVSFEAARLSQATYTLTKNQVHLEKKIIANIKEAVGFDEAKRSSFSVYGTTQFLGNESTFEFKVNPIKNRIVHHIKGPISLTYGKDSTDFWIRNINGIGRKAGRSEKAKIALFLSMLTHEWLSDNSFELVLDEVSKKRITFHYKFADAFISGLITIDAQTYLPQKWTIDSWEGQETFYFRGNLDGRLPWIPQQLDQIDVQGNTIATGFKSREFSQMSQAVFKNYFVPASDFAFSDKVDARVQIKRTKSGHLLIKASINGSNPSWFILDSGAGIDVIDEGWLKNMSNKPIGHIDLVGIGGSVRSNFHSVEKLQIGPVTINNALVSALDLAFLRSLHNEPIAGILGSGFFNRTIIQLDPWRSFATFFESGETLPENLQWLSLSIDEGIPSIQGDLENYKGFFRIDTGEGSAGINIHSGAVTSLNLLKRRETRNKTIWGLGGRMRVQEGEISSFRFGTNTRQQLTVNFLPPSEGALSNPFYYGTMGMGLLKEYNVVFDYRSERVAFTLQE